MPPMKKVIFLYLLQNVKKDTFRFKKPFFPESGAGKAFLCFKNVFN